MVTECEVRHADIPHAIKQAQIREFVGDLYPSYDEKQRLASRNHGWKHAKKVLYFRNGK
jgi:hypothetical protein